MSMGKRVASVIAIGLIDSGCGGDDSKDKEKPKVLEEARDNCSEDMAGVL